jgi:hypothetical protein
MTTLSWQECMRALQWAKAEGMRALDESSGSPKSRHFSLRAVIQLGKGSATIQAYDYPVRGRQFCWSAEWWEGSVKVSHVCVGPFETVMEAVISAGRMLQGADAAARLGYVSRNAGPEEAP